MYQNIPKTRIGKLNENIIFVEPILKIQICLAFTYPQKLYKNV